MKVAEIARNDEQGHKRAIVMPSDPKTPPPPTGLDVTGRRLWRAMQQTLQFDPAETQLVKELCRTADMLEKLAEQLLKHPFHADMLAEVRAQRIVYARLMGACDCPTPMTD